MQVRVGLSNKSFRKHANVYLGKAPLRDILQAEVAGEYIEKKPVGKIDRDAPRRRNLALGHVSTVFYLNSQYYVFSVASIYGHLLGDLYSRSLNSEPASSVSVQMVHATALDHTHCHWTEI
jgi:hypothetical protein